MMHKEDASKIVEISQMSELQLRFMVSYLLCVRPDLFVDAAKEWEEVKEIFGE